MKKFIKTFTNTIAIVSGFMAAVITIDKWILLYAKIKNKEDSVNKEV